MLRHNIYDKCKSRELNIPVNKIRACISNNVVQEAQKDLANYHFISTSKHILTPSHLSPDRVTLAAFDKFRHSHQSSLSGTMANHDTIMIFFQIKPDNLPSKPSKKSLDISNIVLKDKLSCYNLQKNVGARKNLSILTRIIQQIS